MRGSDQGRFQDLKVNGNGNFILVQDQYVFLHQAVMEALVGGDTEIVTQDLRITMNKLTRIHKTSKKPGYAREFKVIVT